MAHDQQVIIAGAGPTGLLNALGLAQQGIDVTVLERSAALQDMPRAIVYHWSTLDGLERLGLFDVAAKTGFLKQDYAYRVHKTGETISYGLHALDNKVKHPYNLHLGQGELARLILEELNRHDNARVLWSREVTSVEQNDDGVVVHVETPDGAETHRADWLIGADGAASQVRKQLGLGFEGTTWADRFVATNIRFPDDREGWAQTTFNADDVYGAVIVKIDESGDHGLWRYAYMEDSALPVEGVTERLPGFLATVFGDDAAAGTTLDAISPYRMHQRSASTYRLGRVFLAGDAAHATNPVGGLGLTSGLFDSYALIEALGAVVTRGVDDSILDLYAEERRAMFVDKASPRATANKQLLFHTADPAELDRGLEVFRRMSRDAEFAAEALFFTKNLESPSLLAR